MQKLDDNIYHENKEVGKTIYTRRYKSVGIYAAKIMTVL